MPANLPLAPTRPSYGFPAVLARPWVGDRCCPQNILGNFPFWRPDPNNQGLYRISSGKAFQAGWHTPLRGNRSRLLNDFYSRQGIERSEYLPAAKEREVLDPWARGRS